MMKLRDFSPGDRVALADQQLDRLSPEGADVVKVGRVYLHCRLRDRLRTGVRLTLRQIDSIAIPNHAARSQAQR